MLKYNSSITALFLNWNKIDYKGAIYLSEALSVNNGV